MENILDYYEYSKLATASYVRLDGMPLDGETIVLQANQQERLPTELARQTFVQSTDNPNPWTIPNGGYHGNDSNGFAATFFQRTNTDGTVDKVLAIRGTEPSGAQAYLDLLKADIGQIGFLGLALGQAVSLVNLMRRLQAPAAVEKQTA